MQRLGSAAVCLALLFCVRDSVGALSGDSAPTGPPTCVSGAKECASESLAGLELNEEVCLSDFKKTGTLDCFSHLEAMEAASQAHSLATSKSQKKRWTKALQMIRDEAYARDFCELRIDDGGDWELVESVPCLEQVMQGDIKKQEWKNAKNTVDLLLKLDAARHSTLKRTKTALGGVLRAKQAGALAEHRMNLKPVDKRANLSLLEFFRDYVRTETPVVLTDTMEECGHNKLKLDFLRSHCSNMSVTPKADNRAAEGWAGLEDTNETTLGAFISGLSTGETSRLYVHDESLATGCREALVSVDFKMPKYFANDYFQRMALVEGNGTLAYPMGDGRNWPSLFVGPEGTRSHLHKDQLRTHFWMAGVEGTKRWTLFREEEEFLLAPNFTIHQFGVNGADPDYETYPLARFAKGWQHVLQPGELLYIPSGAPHQVENLEGPTVALAGNYIDSYSVHKSLHDIQRNKAYGHQETNWELMRTVLENPAFDGTMDLSLDHVPWDDFEKINPQHHARLVSLDPDIWTHINAAVDTVPPEDEDQ